MREPALVGFFVLIAAALLIGTILAVSGAFTHGGVPFHTYFKSAGGLMPGAMVRYGGMEAGKVDAVHVDPKDSTRIEIDFRVRPNIPVKTDSIAKITALGALSDNYVEIGTGKKDSPLAPPGSELKSAETLGIADLGDLIGSLTPVAKQTMQTLNQRLTELQVTIARVNDLLNDRNRANIGGSLGNLNAMLAEDRPKVSASLTNVQTASAKLAPLLDNLKKTMDEANTTLEHVDSLVVENRQDIRTIVVELKQTLLTASSLMEQLKSTTDNNADNIDQIIVNIRVTTENMKELTDSLKANPSLLIRGSARKDRKPGQK
ncbi:MlaD family protein [Edaphobacter bradus]|uniref:MlaD family protein n=1 Tax=Edaphobacter bradus TaxID=2259016 RepID=UPI0021DF6332|nr:MlaD family protein [Edaphobacter bradus]